MKLRDILPANDLISPEAQPLWKANPDVLAIDFDSRAVKKGSLFFAYKGFQSDGKQFLLQAFRQGAVGAVVDSLEGLAPSLINQVLVCRDPRATMARAAQALQGNPSRKLLVFGVTGTNGKTSTCFLLRDILSAAGHRVALLGTVECSYPGRVFHPEHTTQEAPEVQKFLREALDAGATAAVIEVSSHALSLRRVLGCEFNGVLFTNLAADHQDFYAGMEPYFQAKVELFTNFLPPPEANKKVVAAVNVDDTYGRRLVEILREGNLGASGAVPLSASNAVPLTVNTFGLQFPADYSGNLLQIGPYGIRGAIVREQGSSIPIESPLAGTNFNRFNVLAAVAMASATGIKPEAIAQGVSQLQSVPGRLTRVPTTLPFQVFVDFAHSGPKLHSVLVALREICKGRLIVVFGAGGDKDPLRRTSMGEAAAELADVTVITTDNPRSEDPLLIIRTIEGAYRKRVQGVSAKRELWVEPDRRSAIRQALQIASEGDIVCIAGKGHEDGQIIKGVTYPFRDTDEAAHILRELEHV